MFSVLDERVLTLNAKIPGSEDNGWQRTLGPLEGLLLNHLSVGILLHSVFVFRMPGLARSSTSRAS